MKNTLSHPFYFFIFLFLTACSNPNQSATTTTSIEYPDAPYLVVLGVAQDAGYPQADCKKDCCKAVWKNSQLRKTVSCLGVVNPTSNQAWVFDATPDFPDQWYRLQNAHASQQNDLAGIFITHAHIGHYTGLMHLGREVMGAKQIPVYTMPRMQDFLSNHGPWSQLVKLQNIDINALSDNTPVLVNDKISVTPLLVPHRDEFSETVGFKIKGPQKSALFIPDIDKWHLWDRDIIKEIAEVDYAFLDGTFFENGEIPGRDMTQIPHPFIEESIALFKDLPVSEKSKIHFIHFNHTNPVLKEGSAAQKQVEEAGMHIAKEMQIVVL